MVKRCSRCGTEFPATLEFFLARKRSTDGLTSRCRECHRKIVQSWRRNHRHMKHGVDKRLLLEKQNWMCANPNCRKPIDITNGVVDHDHRCCPDRFSCGQCVRGMLCRSCNTTLGFSHDSSEILRGLAAYIELTRKLCYGK
jgi:DNA-directed RNA polymerase subunit RPC12/RpoP